MRLSGIVILASLTVTACTLPAFPPEGTGGTGAGGRSATGGSTMGGTTSTGRTTSGDAGSPTADLCPTHGCREPDRRLGHCRRHECDRRLGHRAEFRRWKSGHGWLCCAHGCRELARRVDYCRRRER